MADAHRGRAADALHRRDFGERGEPAPGRGDSHSAFELGAARLLGQVLSGAAALHGHRPAARFRGRKDWDFIPLRGERDQEHQFGLTIPLRGWAFEVNNYHQRARNYFDHNAIGNSNMFFPLTIDGARLYGWEVDGSLAAMLHRGEVYLSYAYAHAEGAAQ